MSHLEKILDEAFGDKKPKMVSKAIERLRPPREVEKSGGMKDTIDVNELIQVQHSKISEMVINFSSMPGEYWEYCKSSDAKRAWNRAKFGRVHRGSTEQLKKDVIIIKKKMEIVENIPPELLERSNFAGVINEFKKKVEVLKKRNEQKD